MKIAILGAGNVALATACFLADAGHPVHLWSAFAEERAALAGGRLSAEGALTGTVAIAVAETAQAAIDGADLVVVAAPAFGHQALMEAAAPHLAADQTVLIHPVTGLSSLLLSRMMADRGRTPTIVDASTSLFTARRTGPAAVRVLKVKDVIELAAIPADRGPRALAMLEGLFGPRFRLEPNALTVSLNNHNPVYHVPPLLCNLSRAEKREDWMIWEGITPGVARFVQLVDEERLLVVRRYGTREVTVGDYFRQAHGAVGETLPEIFQSVAKKLKGPIGPQSFEHRFITEDVPYALVFFHALGEAAGIAMPVTRNLIELTSALYGRDFTAEGHTLARLGLDGLDPAGIVQRTIDGFQPVREPADG
ncbi:hypothetical protein STVA_11790 [Allostella vacuolata]|nr:hypothetical protein STVA_11790 [Stella vacuolata]